MIAQTLDIEAGIKAALVDLRVSGDSLAENLERVFKGDGAPAISGLLRDELNIVAEDILALTPDGDALRALPAEAVRSYTILPLQWVGGKLKVALIDPTDFYVLLDLHILTGAPILPVAADRVSLEKMIDKHYRSGSGNAGGGYVDFSATTGKPKTDGSDPKPLQSNAGEGGGKPFQSSVRIPLRAREGDSPIIRLVNEIISEAIHAGSSDIHFEPFEREMKVRLRQDGVLRVHRTINARSKAEVVSRLKIMASLDIAEKRRPQDGRIRMEGAGHGIDVRVSTLPTDHGEKVVLRILDKSAVPLDFVKLGLDAVRQAHLERALRLPYGMILMTGPTGAGKTTTLYTCLNLIKSPEVNIVTVEDPIEYKLDGIIQTAVKSEVNYTFANALRTILRQDPNVIMVGEIRDRETAEIAVRAALTGHLVLSTLHTNDAPGAIARLLDMGIEPFLLASALTLVGAQRLVRRVCPHCAVPDAPGQAAGSADPAWAGGARGRGCHHCNRTGYAGRVGLYEIMQVTDGIRSLIAEKKDTNLIRELAIQEGMLGLREDGMAKTRNGLTSLEEVLRETA
ncbi:MAG: GspE/PulE family protein [Fibrobacterota bacterium]|nr:GspE/PulE family protein [Fibrobacterota bacterium]